MCVSREGANNQMIGGGATSDKKSLGKSINLIGEIVLVLKKKLFLTGVLVYL